MENLPDENSQDLEAIEQEAKSQEIEPITEITSNMLASKDESSAEMMAFLRMKKEEFENGYASIFYQQIIKEINAFNEKLDEEHEVGLQLVSFGETIRFNIENIGFQNPYLIVFYGHLNDRSPVQLVQHVSQISFVLIKMPRDNPDLPKKMIGFEIDAAEGAI